jgi:hypothetical protein
VHHQDEDLGVSLAKTSMRIELHRRWPVYVSLLAALGAVAAILWATPEAMTWVLGERGPI